MPTVSDRIERSTKEINLMKRIDDLERESLAYYTKYQQEKERADKLCTMILYTTSFMVLEFTVII